MVVNSQNSVVVHVEEAIHAVRVSPCRRLPVNEFVFVQLHLSVAFNIHRRKTRNNSIQIDTQLASILAFLYLLPHLDTLGGGPSSDSMNHLRSARQ
jgi:hypothetical protein